MQVDRGGAAAGGFDLGAPLPVVGGAQAGWLIRASSPSTSTGGAVAIGVVIEAVMGRLR